jgi:hypothetical protein|tara:strand:- start:255 stop:446 length:192 start_codon:yes stop_codon:yes gene_type:complete
MNADHQTVQYVNAIPAPFKAELTRNAKGDIQYTVSAHASTMAEAMSAVRAAAMEMELTYPRNG